MTVSPDGLSVDLTTSPLVKELNAILSTSGVPIHGPERAGDIRHSRAKIDRIRTELGYAPQVSFAEGLRLTLEWYKSRS